MDLSKLGEILCMWYFQGFIFLKTVLTAPLEFGDFCPSEIEQVIVPEGVWCWLQVQHWLRPEAQEGMLRGMIS